MGKNYPKKLMPWLEIGLKNSLLYSVGKLSVQQQRKCMMFAFTPFGHDRLRPPQSSQCTYRLFYCELGHWIEPHELLYWVYFRLKGKKCWNTKLWTFKVRLNFWFCCERNWIHSISNCTFAKGNLGQNL